MTLNEFTSSVESFAEENRIRHVYAKNWFIYETCKGFKVYPIGIFEDAEEAEVALYQMYCDEDRLTEGY